MIFLISRIDYHYMIGNDSKLYRPKIIEYKFNPIHKYDKKNFVLLKKKKKTKEDEAKKLRTILVIDNNDLNQYKDNYHNCIKNKILTKYFNKNRRDVKYL